MDIGDFDVLIIDGRSGSGKTALANRVAAELERSGISPQLLRVEDLYPGWDGLAEGSAELPRVFATGEYRRYDWLAERFGEPVALEPRLPLIVEGCGALTRASVAAAEAWAEEILRRRPRSSLMLEGSRRRTAPRVRSLWLEEPETVRKPRALERDGDDYVLQWDRWAAQEDALYARTRPWEHATARSSAPRWSDPSTA